jgi:hypothetical protein
MTQLSTLKTVNKRTIYTSINLYNGFKMWIMIFFTSNSGTSTVYVWIFNVRLTVPFNNWWMQHLTNNLKHEKRLQC